MENVINTPERLVAELINLYSRARDVRFRRENVHRGRSHTVSGEFEDLFACYLSNCLSDKFTFFVDQPVTIKDAGLNTQYPDILLLNKNICQDLIDLKMDIGWKRDGLESFAEEKSLLMTRIENASFSYKHVTGNTKVKLEAEFGKNTTYHIIIATAANDGRNLIKLAEELEERFHNIRIYVLTGDIHPNEYDLTSDEIMERIQIRRSEFERLLNALEGETATGHVSSQRASHTAW